MACGSDNRGAGGGGGSGGLTEVEADDGWESAVRAALDSVYPHITPCLLTSSPAHMTQPTAKKKQSGGANKAVKSLPVADLYIAETKVQLVPSTDLNHIFR